MSSKEDERMHLIARPRRLPEVKQSIDYPKERRCTNPYISGVAQLLQNQSAHITHLNETAKQEESLTKVTVQPKEHTQYTQNAIRVENHNYQSNLSDYQRQLREWNPHEDIYSKSTDPYKTLFVGRLPYDLGEVELSKHFTKFGEIANFRLVKDVKTGKSRGYGFITYKSEISLRKAFDEVGESGVLIINDRPVIVDFERGRTVHYFKPRRLGGGLGGRGYLNEYKQQKRFAKMKKNQNIQAQRRSNREYR
ncbi:hypothetical protein ACO0RG_004229 [Hanseniaspora osmophila]|uniref:U1 small nuclear ribonucleoprotein n=1 Tax=Hanseniaspora osmophila TaxID=56408 RepID=A0A1E5RBF9_9ASCO|nr:U1 small nuclear ribonucleoprotein [Hanseniaspora osmophila]